jgi:curved DNA-binding protein CbpA
MPLKTSVIDAFTTLGLDPEAEYSVASKTYKKLALQHHPDKNRADPDATRRFQEISMAWDVCSKHYENPRSSEQSSFGYDSDDDDYDEMEEELMSDFYEFMFRKMFTGGYNRRDRREWHQGHRQHHHHNPNMYFYTPGYGPEMYYDNYQDFQPHYQSRTNGSGSQRSYSTPHSYNQPSQSQKEHEEYLKRVREFEAEVKAEEKENERAAKEEAKAQDRLVQTRVTAFKAARNGDGALLRRTVEEYNLDVTAPEKPRTKSKKTTFESMLHAAARACDEEALSFLISKGASPSALDDSNLSPFHIAILFGNASAIRYFLSIKPTPEGCHPSKAAQDGRKPLQIAMAARTFNAEALSIIVKEATVHDVEKCWSFATSDDVKSILASKVKFTKFVRQSCL